MATKRTIHVVGTGTIGEPLLGLLLHTQRALEVDEITFHKHSPRLGDRAKITNLMRRGARLAVRARSTGLSAADVDRALTEDRSLLITWLNRGTLHLVRREDYAWLHAITTPPLLTGIARRLEQEGVSRAAVDRALEEFGRSQLTRAAGVVLEPVMRALSEAIASGASRTRRHATLRLVHDWPLSRRSVSPQRRRGRREKKEIFCSSAFSASLR